MEHKVLKQASLLGTVGRQSPADHATNLRSWLAHLHIFQRTVNPAVTSSIRARTAEVTTWSGYLSSPNLTFWAPPCTRAYL